MVFLCISQSHGDISSSNVNATTTPPPPKCTSLSSSEQRDSDGGGAMAKMGAASEECLLCYNHTSRDDFYSLLTCNHTTCRGCLENYLIIEITESRTDIGEYYWIVRKSRLPKHGNTVYFANELHVFIMLKILQEFAVL